MCDSITYQNSDIKHFIFISFEVSLMMILLFLKVLRPLCKASYFVSFFFIEQKHYRHRTSNILYYSPGYIIKAFTNIVYQTSNILHRTSNILHFTRPFITIFRAEFPGCKIIFNIAKHRVPFGGRVAFFHNE
jgi:hypothetical protein